MSESRRLAHALDAARVLLLDGATGTELERRGVDASLPLWSTHALLEAPESVAAIHADYAAAGCDLLTANTFRTQERTLSRAGRSGDAERLTSLAVDLAKKAAEHSGRDVLVLGSAPPLEDCYRPDLVPDDRALRDEHTAHANHLAAAGVDAILVETMNTSREAVAAAEAARATGVAFAVSFTCDDRARLLSGEPLDRAIADVAPIGPEVVLVNCLPPSWVDACLDALRVCERFGVYANLGEPSPAGRSHDLDPAAFAEQAARWVGAGARVVGGCCGTTPSHIAAIAARIHGGHPPR